MDTFAPQDALYMFDWQAGGAAEGAGRAPVAHDGASDGEDRRSRNPPLCVASWRAEEAVSRPYRLDITLACADREFDVEPMLGQPARFTARLPNGQRTWHGVVTHIADRGIDREYLLFDVVLEPRLALLREFRRSEVFVQKTLEQIVHAQFTLLDLKAGTVGQTVGAGEAGGAIEPDFDLRLANAAFKSTQRSFTCQFEETSLDFLSRHLEREGVYYWFEQGHDKETVVLADDRYAQPDDVLALPYRPAGTRDAEGDAGALIRLHRRLGGHSARVRLRDFAASSAAVALEVEEPVTAPAGAGQYGAVGEYGLYAEHYDTQKEGRRLAGLRAQEIACRRDRYQGTSHAVGVRAGWQVRVQGHERASHDGDYYVVEVMHQGRQPLPGRADEGAADAPEYRNDFVAIPAELQFRPPRVTRRPRIIGLVSAIIEAEDTTGGEARTQDESKADAGGGDGAQGKPRYAPIDDKGRYRVRFPFAGSRGKPARNSAWVRMATPYAGNGHGMHLPLLEGTEVMVGFISGDPDRPVIMAAVNNSENPNMLDARHASQPGLRTAGGNALAFEDREGKQAVVLGSPIGKSQIALGTTGAGDDGQGIRMLSHNHMDLTSTSYSLEIPGIYTHHVIPLAGRSAARGDNAGDGDADSNHNTEGNTDSGNGSEGNNNSNDGSGSGSGQKDQSGLDKFEEALSTSWWDGRGKVDTKVGLSVSNYLGLSNATYWGMRNSLFVLNKNDIIVGVEGKVKIGGTISWSLTNRFDYSFPRKKTVAPVEQKQVADSDQEFLSLRIQAVQEKEELGEYKATVAGDYRVAALFAQFEVVNTRFRMTPSTVELTTPGSLKTSGLTATTLGDTTSTRTSVLGVKVSVGASETNTVSVIGMTSVQLESAGTTLKVSPMGAQINGMQIRLG